VADDNAERIRRAVDALLRALKPFERFAPVRGAVFSGKRGTKIDETDLARLRNAAAALRKVSDHG
jgi:hypothetical protein